MLASSEEVTSVWLTRVLREAGMLPSGDVCAIEKWLTDAFNSATMHLYVTYTADAPASLPRAFILKRNNDTTWGKGVSRDEVQFYQFIAKLPDYPQLMVPCYSANYDEVSGNSYLLLLDLSTTHLVPVRREQQIAITKEMNVPAQIYIERAIEVLATFHAYWWEHPLLGSERFPLHYNDSEFADYIQRRRNAVAWLLDNEGSLLTPTVQTLCAETAAHFDRWWTDYLASRMETKSHITLIHGDAYFANMLSPREGVTGQTYLIDWQSAEPHLGAFDLVNLCATFWTREQRNSGQREQHILRHYLAQLRAHGIQNYSWENLLLDYRLAIIEWLLSTVQDAYNGSKRSYWQPKLHCISATFEDWHCAELLSSHSG